MSPFPTNVPFPLEIVRRPQRRPVLVHCEQGFHRTGILCAAYRIRVCQWPVEQALEELRFLGFEFERPKRRALVDALLAWAAQSESARSVGPPSPTASAIRAATVRERFCNGNQ